MDRHHRRTHLHHQKRAPEPQQKSTTVVATVYKTVSPTFSGPVAGYSTVSGKTTPTSSAKTTKATTTPKPNTTSKSTGTTQKASTTSPSIPPKPSETNKDEDPKEEEDIEDKQLETDSTTIFPLTTSTLTSSFVSNTIDSALNTGSPTPSISPDNDKGSGGGSNTAGIVGGSIAGLLIFFAIVAFFYRRRKQKTMNEAYGKTEDEKSLVSVNSNEKPFMPIVAASSPRLSVRPVTTFNPNLNLNPPAASPVVKTGPSSNEIARKPIPAPLPLAHPPPMAAGPEAQPSPTLSAFSDGFVPGTPVSAVDAGAILAGGKPAPVHRVQMDYSPVQPDELEIRTGQLVRMLHEYDDGWALCIRMDRSQQGVCPRTCLSIRPVKPRPNPAPGSPGQNQQRRGPPPSGNGPYSPVPPQGFQNQSRPQTPVGQQRQAPYPQSAGSRPQTPVQQHRPQTPRTPQQLPQITVSHSDAGSPPQGGSPRRQGGHGYHAM